jgi:type II secretory pathway component GspD/PulD (secretin)
MAKDLIRNREGKPDQSENRPRPLGFRALAVMLMICFAGEPGRAEPALSQQILIEANIWEINESANIDYGIVWDLIDLDAEINDLLDSSIYLPGFLTGGGIGQTGNPAGAFIQTTLDILREQNRDGVTDDYIVAQLNTTLQAATRDGTVHLRANPKIVVVENQQAVIHAGDRFPIVELTVTKEGYPTLETNYHDTGVKLTVWPKVYRDEFVILSVRPEVTDITSFVEMDIPPAVPGGAPVLFLLPVLSTRDAYSQMIVRSGGTVIMSGLLLESQREVIREVPLISKIPLLGWLFRSRNWTRIKNDILIEITPTILQAGESRYTPNGLIYEGEVFRSNSDIIRHMRETEGGTAEEAPGPARAEDWFGVSPEEESPAEPPAEGTPPEEVPSGATPEAAGAETTAATPEGGGGS